MKHGSTRSVLFVGKYAIKLPRCFDVISFLSGMIANVQEARLSKVKEFEGKVCPVLFCFPFGLFLVMPKCEPLDEKWQWMGVELIEMWQNKQPVPTVELKNSSFGIYKGNIVAVDYGN